MNYPKIILSIVFSLVISIASEDADDTPKFLLEFEPCPDVPLPLEMKVKDCETQPCECKMGDEFTTEAIFIPEKELTGIKSVTKIKLGNTWVNFNLIKVGGSTYIEDMQLPILTGKRKRKCLLTLPIKESYPKIGITFEHNLKDQTGKDLFCYRVRARPEPTLFIPHVNFFR